MAPSARFRALTREERTAGGTEIQVMYNSPSLQQPLDSARHAPARCVGYRLSLNAGKIWIMRSLLQLNLVGARSSRAAPGRSGPLLPLILFFACLFSRSFTRQRSLHTLFFAGLQVEGVSLDLLNDVFLLHLALEAAESILEGFPLLKPYFCQTRYTPRLVRMDRIVITRI